jgi:hypothetical protein
MLGLAVSPWWMINMRSIKTESPALQKMSDIVFLTYYEFWRKLMRRPQMSSSGDGKVPPPKYIVVQNIQEEGDDDEMKYFGYWPGVTFTPEQEGFFALLYTKQGRGIAAFLFNHKNSFGPRRVGAITVWHSEAEESYCLRFEMEDSPELELAGQLIRRDSLEPGARLLSS